MIELSRIHVQQTHLSYVKEINFNSQYSEIDFICSVT
jgi:hypothetical protein